MKLRKLFAGVAAAATLLGGMAFGATAANAADTASITLSGKTVKGTVYTAYKIGSYDTASAKVEKDKLASVGVTTDQAWKTDVFCQIFVGRFGVSFSPFERLFLGRFGFGQSCGLSVIA